MFVKTSAIVLRVHPWSNSSHLVTWITPGHGRVTTRVKGACRPKSMFLGQYDLFYTCELIFYTRDTGGVHSIREVSPLNLREPLRHDWRAASTANYYADLACHVSVPMQESRAHYALLQHDLDALCNATPTLNDILRHEARLLKLLGLSPGLAHCPQCHTHPLQAVRYSVTAAQPLCEHTRPPAHNDRILTVPLGVLTALARLFQERGFPIRENVQERGFAIRENEKTTTRIENPRPQNFLLGIRRFLGIFMRLHIDLPMGSRRTLFDLFSSLPARHAQPCDGNPL